MFAVFRKLLSKPPLRSDRLAVYAKQDGDLYYLDGSSGIEKKILLIPIWPIGSVYISVLSTNPATLLGFGTWVRIAEGRTLVSQQSSDVDFDTAEEVGGAKTITLTAAQIPSHTHIQNSHNHTQNSHNHTQNSHNHTQVGHAHTHDGATIFDFTGVGWKTGTSTTAKGGTLQATTATNQATTATNQATTATNQATTATNQTAGSGQAHNNMPPYVVVYTWKRTA